MALTIKLLRVLLSNSKIVDYEATVVTLPLFLQNGTQHLKFITFEMSDMMPFSAF